MRSSLVGVAVFAAVFVGALPQVAEAQQKLLPAAVGPFEVGAFGQVDFLDDAMKTDQVGWGLGGRLGWLFHRNWEAEAEVSFSRAGASAGRVQTGDVQINYYIARLDYNIPFKGVWGIVSAGIGADAIDDHSDLILSPEIGFRIPIAQDWHVRIDGSLMFAPNPTSATYKFPATAASPVNESAAYLTNYQIRAGISWLPRQPAESLHVAVNSNGANLAMVCTGAQPSTPITATVTSNRRSDIMQTVTWRSDNPNAASVDQNTGMVTARGAGNATITATSTIDPRAMASTRVGVTGTSTRPGRQWAETTYKNIAPMSAQDTAIFFQTDSPRVAPGRGKVKHTQEELNALALRDTSKAVLDRWIALLKGNAGARMADTGWADVRASAAHNDSLSQRRADAAAEYLFSNGIDRSRVLSEVGKGETNMFDPMGKTRAQKLQANRRVKLSIMAGTERVIDQIIQHQDPPVCTAAR